MRVTVIGLGYVGLVTAACAADWDHDVHGIEANGLRITELREGRTPFHEPGLAELVTSGLASGRLRVTGPSRAAVAGAELVVIAVGTHDGNGGWQSGQLLDAIRDVVPHMAYDAVLCIRSTLPLELIGRLAGLVAGIREASGRGPIPVLLNPEFTREGTAVRDFTHPDRIVMGIVSDPDGQGAAALHRFYRRVDAPTLSLDATDAALAKLGSNLFLATKISFANELAAICEAFGGRVEQVVSAMALDPRIGGSFLRAGVGFGGSCLPHQVMMTVRDAASAGVATPLLGAVDHVNHAQRLRFVERLETLLGRLEGTRIALLGLAFKPDTDDLRDAPSLEIASMLMSRDAAVVAYDPMPAARARAAATVPGLSVAECVEDALTGADAVGLVTEWPEFAAIDWMAAGGLLRTKVVVDGRNALPADELVALGFRYSGFGRPSRDGAPMGATAPAAARAAGDLRGPDGHPAPSAPETLPAIPVAISIDRHLAEPQQIRLAEPSQIGVGRR